LAADGKEHNYREFDALGALGQVSDLEGEKYLTRREDGEDAPCFTITESGRRYYNQVLASAEEIRNRQPYDAM
jgi:hypothetical protein